MNIVLRKQASHVIEVTIAPGELDSDHELPISLQTLIEVDSLDDSTELLKLCELVALATRAGLAQSPHVAGVPPVSSRSVKSIIDLLHRVQDATRHEMQQETGGNGDDPAAA